VLEFIKKRSAMKVLTSFQMKEIDKKTIEEIGIPGPVLMENAGLQIVKAIKTKFPDLKKERIIIVAGKGNNGGDGLVVARHLYNQGCDPTVLLLAAREDIRGDAALNLGVAEKMGIKIVEVRSLSDWKARRIILTQAKLLIDAIFGTGLLKAADGLYAAAIEDINRSKAYKVSVDIPSGLSSDSYALIGPCVKADLTITLAAPKIAHVFPPAEECVGELVVADISVPRFLFADVRLRLELVEKESLLPYFQRRKRDSHKGSYGHLLIISGSLGKTGAAVMAGKGALKMGAGLVTVATARGCLPIIARSMMELMTEPLAETSEKTISAEALPRALELLNGKNALLIGPGISTHPSTAKFVLSLLPRIKIPVVIDADGLNILSAAPEILKALSKPAILTPHPGEFARLLGLPTEEVIDKKLELAPDFAKKYGVYLVLKGYRTLTATPKGEVFINPTGNPGMATAGSGDVLSGMIASEIVQENDVLGATLAAIYVHGLSGDMAARRLGEKYLTAGDLIRALPRALKDMEGK
jgi:hydroxyethylthiazole kinase-like uncharacterized protein yjeF